MKRIPDVIDCWYDSGSASFAQFHYPFENKKEFEKRFPYDFIAEAIDQTRGWFYTLHAIATILFDDVAYKNVICAGHIVDENGEKMSKSKGNIIQPKEIFEEVGIDAVRLQFCTTDSGNQKRFSVNMVKESILPFLNVLANCKTFYEQAAKNKNNTQKQLEDKWILSRLNSLIKKATEDLENYKIDEALLSIINFVVNDFSRTYIKMTRDREDTKEVLGEILKNISLLLAPYAPYISEHIYKDFSKESVHLSEWPKFDKKLIDKKLEEEFSLILGVIEKGLYARDKAQIGLKWPLAKAKITTNNSISKELQNLIATQLNIKEIEIKKDKKTKEISVELDINLTPELEAEGYAREISRKVQDARKRAGLIKTDKIKLALVVDDGFARIINKQANMIKQRTNASKIIIGEAKERDYTNKSNEKIKEKDIMILLGKI